MKLNHANLAVADVAATADFFIRHFNFTQVSARGDAFAILDDGNGFTFNLMVPAKGEAVSYSRNFHIGFFVETDDIVAARHAALVAAGAEPTSVARTNRGNGSLGFYCMTPGGFIIEVAHHY